MNYMNGIMSDRPLIRRIDQYIKELKENEERRKEYMLMQAFEMDARKESIQQGKSLGLAEGSRQAKLETAQFMKQANCDISFIKSSVSF